MAHTLHTKFKLIVRLSLFLPRRDFISYIVHFPWIFNLTFLIIIFSFRPPLPTKPLQSLFRIALTYCPFAGTMSVLLIGVPMSYLIGKSKSDSMNPDVFCPLTQSLLHKSQTRSITASHEVRSPKTDEVYIALDEALKHLKEVIDR